MIPQVQLLTSIPQGLRDPLIEEYNSIVRNYMERRWSPSELSGGRFCEVVYSILDGHALGSYATSPSKPRDFLSACRALESQIRAPRSFQILIPRLLPALYEIRNNRGVGHTGGDVDPNLMDASAVLAMASWIMAELVRVYHNLPIAEAQRAVDNFVERRLPVVWTDGNIRRVLDPGLPLKDQIVLLIASCSATVPIDKLFKWTDYQSRAHFNRILRTLHKARFVELDEESGTAIILPPGTDYVTELIQNLK